MAGTKTTKENDYGFGTDYAEYETQVTAPVKARQAKPKVQYKEIKVKK